MGKFLKQNNIQLHFVIKLFVLNLNSIENFDFEYFSILHVRNHYCKIKEALQTCKEAEAFIQQIKHYNQKANFAGIYSEVSAFYFIQSNYSEVRICSYCDAIIIFLQSNLFHTIETIFLGV